MCAKGDACPSGFQDKSIIVLFHRKTLDVFQSAVCTVPWRWQPAKNCLSIGTVPWDSGVQAPLATTARRSQGIPWAAATKLGHQTRVQVPFWEMLALWGMAEGQHKDIAHPLRPLETIEVGPYICVEVQPCLSDCTYKY